jgi:UDP-glucose 4-epimerase
MTAERALITGGAGFIGSHLAEHLLTQGWRVVVLDNFATGSPANVQHLQGRAAFELVEGDAADERLMDRLASESDVLFHLAAVVGVERVVADPVGTVERNHAATKAVLHVASRHQLRVIFTSSSEVYGANPAPAFREEDACIIGPTSHRRWCYSASKLHDEFHAYAFHYAHRLPVTIVRLFNTVGPRQVGHYGMVVPRFVGRALAGEPLVVYGDGTQRRCFTFVGDVVLCLEMLTQTDGAAGQVFNIGSTEETSIRALAERVKALTGSESPVHFRSYREAYGEHFEDVPHRRPNVERLRAAIGYAPDTPLDEALQSVIDHLRAAGES